MHYHTWHALQTRGLIRLSRGDEQGSTTPSRASSAARSSVDPSVLGSALGIYGRMLVLVGRADERPQALDESLAIFDIARRTLGIRLAVHRRHGLRARRGRERVLTSPRHRVWAEAARWYFAGEFGRAADAYEEIGSLTDEAEARLRAAKSLLERGENGTRARCSSSARSPSTARVGATRYVSEGEALLADGELRGSRVAPARARSPRRAP